jgi:hypothetical protein
VVIIVVLMQFEGVAVDCADVLHCHHLHQVVLQGLQLEICLAVVVGQDWDAVVALGGVGVGRVVDQYHFVHGTVYYTQIFAVHAFGGLVAMLAEEAVVDVLVVGVDVVQHNVGVA